MKNKKVFKLFLLLLFFIVLSSHIGAAVSMEMASKRFIPKKLEMHILMHDELNRRYALYLPSSFSMSNNKLPLLIALHGGGGAPQKWGAYTNYGFEKLAEQEGFILAYPEGIEKQWNDGRHFQYSYAHRNNIDDIGFLGKLIDHLVKTYPIDKNRVFVTGASNGGMMAHYLGIYYSDKIAAIAPVIASIPKNIYPTVMSKEPISVLMINGMDDPLVLWEGGVIQLGRRQNGEIVSLEETLQFWLENNQCDTTAIIEQLSDRDPKDLTRVFKSIYPNGKNGSEVILYAIEGGGHAWPAFEDKSGRRILKRVVNLVVGRKSRDIDACQVIWNFFKNHPKVK